MATEQTKRGMSRRQARKLMGVFGPMMDVHHKDEDPLNNRIDNLEIMGRGEHQRHHLHNRLRKSVEVLERLLFQFNHGIF
ncbi:MAG TPA: HNH endonuclease [Candidatus Wunengus sp. YC61]|uniref:HNH endonuclease n=1 Tax=Candidatus Wunengus sp. YC61 TaxID=3367698 RepID=UPI004025CCF4